MSSPTPACSSTDPPPMPAAITARAGHFAYDTMTLIGPGTWEAARAAVDAALTAADLVLAGEPAAYACCRPPGHHATRSAFGGSCYLNNPPRPPRGCATAFDGPVAVIDIDAHHGNGTQAIFYERPRGARGLGARRPWRRVVPSLPRLRRRDRQRPRRGGESQPAAGAGRRRRAVARAVAGLPTWARDRDARALVVALGVDAAAGDPESPLRGERRRLSGRRADARRARPADRRRPGGRLRPRRDRAPGRARRWPASRRASARSWSRPSAARSR